MIGCTRLFQMNPKGSAFANFFMAPGASLDKRQNIQGDIIIVGILRMIFYEHG